MSLEVSIIEGIVLVIIAFLAEYMDSSLGMGYGTTLTPLLLAFGFTPLQIVPCILLSEFLSGMAAAILHHKAGNVFFDFSNSSESKLKKRMGKLGYLPNSRDSQVAFVLSLCSVIGTIVAVFIAINISKFYLKLYIGLLVLAMGILILIKRNSNSKFSWKKITGLGTLASFNKGLSGGGYGPLITSGQILSGVNAKSAIGITSFAESLTCFVGVAAYVFMNDTIDWALAPYLVIGALLSVPLSVKTVKAINTKKFIVLVGITTIILGLYTLIKL